MKYALGIDIGGTNTKLGIVTSDGQIVAADTLPTESESDFSTFVKRVFEKSAPLIEKHKVTGIGVGAPNANAKTGRIEYPPNLNWEVENLVQDFEAAFKLPTKLENDANLSAVGEKLWGQGKDLDDFIVVTLGTGLGTGVFSSGRLINSEGGHITIVKDGRPCGCGGKGHLECYASVRGIKETVKELTGKDMKFAEILQLYKNKDTEIKKQNVV